MATLFWALFGLPDISVVDFTTAVGTKHYFTQTVGNLLYATYHVIAIVVLLNVLIAMMSNTYTRVEVSFHLHVNPHSIPLSFTLGSVILPLTITLILSLTSTLTLTINLIPTPTPS